MGVTSIYRRLFPAKPYQLLGSMPSSDGEVIFSKQRFPATLYQVRPATYRRLGLDPVAFSGLKGKLNPRDLQFGATVKVMDLNTYRYFCDWTAQAPLTLLASAVPVPSGRLVFEIPTREASPRQGIDHAVTGGMYPLSKMGELEKVRQEKIPHLSPFSRVVLLPERFTMLDLKHELLHDLFLGSAFSPEMRRSFISLVVEGAKKAFTAQGPNGGSKEFNAAAKNWLTFFEEVNRRCNIQYQIEALAKEPRPLGRDEIGPNLFTFAGECFVYAWEQLLGHRDKSFGAVPEDLENFLIKYPVA